MIEVKAWIGKTVFAIGILHTVVGLVAFRWRLAELVREGLVNTVDGRPERGFPFWFIVCGILWMIFGAFLNWVERMGLVFPRFLGWSIFLFAAALIVVMPVSGAWLLMVPALGAIHRSRRARGTETS